MFNTNLDLWCHFLATSQNDNIVTSRQSEIETKIMWFICTYHVACLDVNAQLEMLYSYMYRS